MKEVKLLNKNGLRREVFIAVSFALLLLPSAGLQLGAAEGPPELPGIGDTLAW